LRAPGHRSSLVHAFSKVAAAIIAASSDFAVSGQRSAFSSGIYTLAAVNLVCRVQL